MTLKCLVIRKVSGNFQVNYTDGKREVIGTDNSTWSAFDKEPKPAKMALKRANTRKMGTPAPITPAQAETVVSVALAEIATEPVVITTPAIVNVPAETIAEQACELSPSERGVVFSVPMLAMADYISLYPEAGIPAKKDTFHIVTLTAPIHKGMSLPIGTEAGIYPVYIIANQNGDMMRTVTTDKLRLAESKENNTPVKSLGWYYRNTATCNGDSQAAQDLAIKDLKALKSWQRAYYNAKQVPAEYIKLTGQGTLKNGFSVSTKSLLDAVKVYGKMTVISLAGYLLPAHIVAAICKVAGSDNMQITLETSRHAVILRHGNATTRILAQLENLLAPGTQIIPVTF